MDIKWGEWTSNGVNGHSLGCMDKIGHPLGCLDIHWGVWTCIWVYWHPLGVWTSIGVYFNLSKICAWYSWMPYYLHLWIRKQLIDNPDYLIQFQKLFFFVFEIRQFVLFWQLHFKIGLVVWCIRRLR